MGNEAKTAWYVERLRRLSDLLYRQDPYGMGSLVGAPSDEYEAVAMRLMPALSRAADRRACAKILEERDIRGETLVDAVWAVFAGR